MGLRLNIDWRTDLPQLVGDHVVLREPTSGDAFVLSRVLSVPDASHFGIETLPDPRAVDALVARVRQHREFGVSFCFAIVAAEQDTVVGLVEVRRLDPRFDTAECECTLAPQVRGSGVFEEVAHLVGTFAFEVVGVQRLQARTVVDDGRTAAALRKVGAIQEGVLRRSVRRDGRYVDQVIWSILRDEWVASEHQPSRDH